MRAGVLQLIEKERDGDMVDRDLLKSVVNVRVTTAILVVVSLLPGGMMVAAHVVFLSDTFRKDLISFLAVHMPISDHICTAILAAGRGTFLVHLQRASAVCLRCTQSFLFCLRIWCCFFEFPLCVK